MHRAVWHHATPRTGPCLRALVIALSVLLPLVLGACSLSNTNAVTGPTATVGPSPTPTPTILYQSTLATDTGDWTVDQNCFYGAGGYHIKGGFVCYAPSGILVNVDVSVQVKQVAGPTTYPYGIVFRRASKGNYYDFKVDSNSKWILLKCVDDTCTRLVDFTANAAIPGGLNTPKTIEVVAIDSHFDFFVNGTKVGQVNDFTFDTGMVGLSGADGIEVVFSNITIIQPTGTIATPISAPPGTVTPGSATPAS